MNKILLAMALSALFAAQIPAALAAQTAQQQRMADCSAKNKGKTGNDYKAAQKACLSGKDTASASTPQERMKSCNADATASKLAGDARKDFMSRCLKKS